MSPVLVVFVITLGKISIKEQVSEGELCFSSRYEEHGPPHQEYAMAGRNIVGWKESHTLNINHPPQ